MLVSLRLPGVPLGTGELVAVAGVIGVGDDIPSDVRAGTILKTITTVVIKIPILLT